MRLKHFNLQLGSQILKSFSDESRIRILHLLYRNKEMCITDIVRVLDFTQTKTSRHLIYLKNAGIVNSKKIDQWAIYAIKEEVLDFVEIIYKYLDRDTDLIKDQENYDVLLSNRELAAPRFNQRMTEQQWPH